MAVPTTAGTGTEVTRNAVLLVEQDIARVVPEAARASSMRGNPIELEPGELEAVLRRAW